MTEEEPKKKRNLSKWVKRGLLVLASLLVALIALEVAARVLHIGSGGFWEPHPQYGWRNIPDASGWESCFGECETHVEINSLGLRDREIPYENPEEAERILLLGDSLSAGMQVPLEETYAKALERSLNEAEEGQTWEVINGSVNGYGTDNELLFYRLEGSKYEPEIVLLSLYLANDVYNNSRELEVRLGGAQHKPYFELEEDGELSLHNFPVQGVDSISNRASTFLKRYFQLPRAVAEMMSLRTNVPEALRPLVELAGGRTPQTDPQPQAGGDQPENSEGAPENNEGAPQNNDGARGARSDICSERYSPIITEAWDITKALIVMLNEEVESSGAQLMVMAIPASPQLSIPEEGKEYYCDRPNDELGQFLASEEIPYLDLLPAFREYVVNGGQVPYFDKDFHMRSEGHALAAEQLAPFIEQASGR